jgi:hypothetical protein
MKKTVKAWAVPDMDNPKKLQEYQLGEGMYYEGGYKLYLRKKDALDACEYDEDMPVPCTITYELPTPHTR